MGRWVEPGEVVCDGQPNVTTVLGNIIRARRDKLEPGVRDQPGPDLCVLERVERITVAADNDRGAGDSSELCPVDERYAARHPIQAHGAFDRSGTGHL